LYLYVLFNLMLTNLNISKNKNERQYIKMNLKLSKKVKF